MRTLPQAPTPSPQDPPSLEASASQTPLQIVSPIRNTSTVVIRLRQDSRALKRAKKLISKSVKPGKLGKNGHGSTKETLSIQGDSREHTQEALQRKQSSLSLVTTQHHHLPVPLPSQWRTWSMTDSSLHPLCHARSDRLTEKIDREVPCTSHSKDWALERARSYRAQVQDTK